MRILVRLASWVFVYLCIGSIVTAAVGMGYLWSSGKLDDEKLVKILAVVHDVTIEKEETPRSASQAAGAQQPSYDENETVRDIMMRKLELKRLAVDKAIEDIRYKRQQLDSDRERHQRLVSTFDAKLESLFGEATAEGFAKQRRIWENIKSTQAKDQIIQMVEQEEIEDVVAILSEMPVEKQAKIVSQFTTEAEIEVLDNILRMVRQGLPQTALIEQTRNSADVSAPNPIGTP
ncbi:MAG: hypothetical protein WDZ59_02955 [Pirellulales bacterium]